MAKGRKTGGGSRKGKPNKVTAEVRAVIAEIAKANAPKVQGWLDSVAKDDAAKALHLYLQLLEYDIPKLARQEHTGEGGGPVYVYSRNKHDDEI